jgi:NAD(P)-dependent dehydrogenase (short-subunit alcohol dehydrogenase family)
MSKRVLITGGGSGIGKAMAETFAAEGARIFITDLSAIRRWPSARTAG